MDSLKVRTVLLAGVCEKPAQVQHSATTKLWRWGKRKDPDWRAKQNEYRREWRKANPEMKRAQEARYREKHLEKMRAYWREYSRKRRKVDDPR